MLSLADKKFLEFFFKRVKVNTSSRYESDFPYVSPCGRETNYIHCDDLPIVFSHLLAPDSTVVQDIASYGNSNSQQCSTDETPLDDGAPLDGTPLDDGAPLEYGTVSCKGSGRATGDDRTSSITTNTATSSTEPMHPSSVDTNVSKAVSTATDVVTRDRTGSLSPVAVASLAYGGTHSLRIPFQPRSLCMLPASGRVYHAGPERLGGVGLVKSSLAIELSRFFVYEEGAGESAHPVGFRWRGRTWELDTSVLGRLVHLTSICE